MEAILLYQTVLETIMKSRACDFIRYRYLVIAVGSAERLRIGENAPSEQTICLQITQMSDVF